MGSVGKLKYIFLDIDGVLNNHSRMCNGYCSIHENNVIILNKLLDYYPDAKIVISSAWRYLIVRGDMTVSGFQNMMSMFGIKSHNRIIGHTRPDKDDYDNDPRIDQILDWLVINDPLCDDWIAIDDMFLLNDPRCIKTDGNLGLVMSNFYYITNKFPA